MENFYQKTEEIIVRLFNCYANLQRSQHEYYPGVKLYPSEIHAIECIATTRAINLTELSNQLGLTKGAVSKSVGKLEKLGLLRRYKYVSNQKEVYFHLTELGVQAYEGHKKYHESMIRVLEQYGESVSQEKGEEILRFLQLYLEQMQTLD